MAGYSFPLVKNISIFIPVLTGFFTEFTTVWYNFTSGVIVMTIGFNVVLPFIATLIHHLFFKCGTCIDRGDVKGKKFHSNTITRHKFFEIHVGPEFPYELRYSAVSI